MARGSKRTPNKGKSPIEQPAKTLAELLKDLTEFEIVRNQSIGLFEYGIFSQERKSFDTEFLAQLADSIALQGLRTNLIIAVWSRKEMVDYLDLINDMDGTAVSIDSCTRFRHGRRYHVLLAGEQRTRSMRDNLWMHGCSICRAEHGEEAPGTCFARHAVKHFPDGQINCDFVMRPDVYSARFIQIAENLHKEPKIHERARNFYSIYQVLRRKMPKITIAEFARLNSQNPQMMAKLLHYCELPPQIQDAVAVEDISFAHSYELWRLQNAGYEEGEQMRLLRLATDTRPRMQVGKLRELVKARIIEKERERQETALSELFSLTAVSSEPELRARLKRTTLRDFMDAHAHLRRIAHTFEREVLGPEESPLSNPENMRWMALVVKTATRSLDDLDRVVKLLIEAGIPNLIDLKRAHEKVHARKPEQVLRVAARLIRDLLGDEAELLTG